MNVGIITSHMSFDEHGGANYSRHLLGQQLEARGHDVTIYTLNFADENHVPVEHDYELVETRIDSWTMFDGVARFYQKVGRYFGNHDVIHAYVPGIISLLQLYREATGDETPLFGHLNGYTPFCTNTAIMSDGCWQDCSLADKFRHSRQEPAGKFSPGGVARMGFNHVGTDRLLSRVDGLFCLSPAVAQIYDEYGVDDSVLEVVPNMVDPNFQTASDDADSGRQAAVADGGPRADGGDETRILYVGRVDAMKSIGDLLDAVAAMDSAGYHVDIVGDNILDYGMGLDGYRERAGELGIDDRVTFHGWVDYQNLSPYYERGDLFVHPAQWPEPFGRTIIEAMQHGLPIVCGDVGAPPWVSGSAGVTYPVGDTTALADQLDTLLADSERRRRMAQYTQVELERFEPSLVTGQIIESYEGVL